MKIKSGILILALVPLLTGCGPVQKATDVSNVINGILQIAQTEESALPTSDSSIITPFVNLGLSLDSQLNTCIAGLNSASKKSSFAACFNSFASGLLSPTELSQLRIVSQKSQNNIQVVVTAIVLGVNTALAYFGSSAITNPTISASTPNVSDFMQLENELNAKGIAIDHVYMEAEFWSDKK